MSTTTTIEWTRGDDGTAGASWNPVTGCTKVSEGCDHCYAETFAERWRGIPGHPFEQGFDVRLWPDRLRLPLKWRKPKRVFVNSMSDLFIGAEQVPDAFVAAVWATMYWTSAEARTTKPVRTYQILTKRPARMRVWLRRWANRQQRKAMLAEAAGRGWADAEVLEYAPGMPAVLPNVWLGVSVENQRWADIRVPILLEVEAAVRFLSCEPLLGPIDLEKWLHDSGCRWSERSICTCADKREAHPNWVIVGGESGPRARPMHPAWVRQLREQCCAASDVAFFFKQWGQWWPTPLERDPAFASGTKHQTAPDGGWASGEYLNLVGPRYRLLDDDTVAVRLGKKRAGRDLDGRTWDQFPSQIGAGAGRG